MSKNSRNSLLNRVRVSKLSFGIHDNCIISNVDLSDRKRSGQPEKKMIYITLSTVDPDTRKKKSEVELSWFKFDHTSDYLFSNIRELIVQLHGILMCYMTEEEAYTALDEVFASFNIAKLSELEAFKWRKKDLDILMQDIKDVFDKAIVSYIGTDKDLIRVKITTDNKGEYTNIPKFGVFTESMTVEKIGLIFSNYEHKNHSKAGTTGNETMSADVLKQL